MAFDPFYDDSYDDEGFDDQPEQEPDFEEMLDRRNNRDADKAEAIMWGGLDI